MIIIRLSIDIVPLHGCFDFRECTSTEIFCINELCVYFSVVSVSSARTKNNLKRRQDMYKSFSMELAGRTLTVYV